MINVPVATDWVTVGFSFLGALLGVVVTPFVASRYTGSRGKRAVLQEATQKLRVAKNDLSGADGLTLARGYGGGDVIADRLEECRRSAILADNMLDQLAIVAGPESNATKAYEISLRTLWQAWSMLRYVASQKPDFVPNGMADPRSEAHKTVEQFNRLFSAFVNEAHKAAK